MARPWPKRSDWPYVAKSGRRSYRVGFYDHEKRERTRTFPSARHAREWMHDYSTAERRGCDSLRRFLLDLDAKEVNEAEGRTIAQILELFMELDAHPSNEEGLAPSTYDHYTSVLNCHLLGKPATATRRQTCAGTRGLRRRDRHNTSYLLQRATNTARLARADARSRCSPVDPYTCVGRAFMRAELGRELADGAEIHANGCKLAKEPVISRRRSAQRGGTGYAPATRPRPLASWALTASRRGYPYTYTARRRTMPSDPRPSRRDDREPAIRTCHP